MYNVSELSLFLPRALHDRDSFREPDGLLIWERNPGLIYGRRVRALLRELVFCMRENENDQKMEKNGLVFFVPYCEKSSSELR